MKGIAVTPRIKGMVYDRLDFLGVSPANRGYDYLADLVCEVLNDPNSLHSITKVYNELGLANGSTGFSVERVVRHSIESLFNRMTPDSPIRVYFSYIDPEKGKCTNKEFIATVANLVRRDLMEDLEENHEIPGQTKIGEV